MTMSASNVPMSPDTICTCAVFCPPRVTFSADSFNINTYEFLVRNSFIINTYKNKGLKVV